MPVFPLLLLKLLVSSSQNESVQTFETENHSNVSFCASLEKTERLKNGKKTEYVSFFNQVMVVNCCSGDSSCISSLRGAAGDVCVQSRHYKVHTKIFCVHWKKRGGMHANALLFPIHISFDKHMGAAQIYISNVFDFGGVRVGVRASPAPSCCGWVPLNCHNDSTLKHLFQKME